MNHTGLILLSSAVQKIFPKEKIFYSHVDSQGFSIEFSYSGDFQESYLSLIEEQMRTFSNEEIQIQEMLASNAKEFFLHHKQEELAKTLEGIQGTVFVANLASFFTLGVETFQPCQYFSLFEFRQNKNRVFLSGVAFAQSHEKNSFLKKWRQYPKKNGEFLGKELALFEKPLWHPRGLLLKSFLKDFANKFLKKEGFNEIETTNPTEYFSKTGVSRFYLWKNFLDKIYWFDEESLFSILQLMEKWIKIFDLEAHWVLTLSNKKKGNQTFKKILNICQLDVYLSPSETKHVQLEIRIADGLGRYSTGPVIQLEKKFICFSLFGDLECFISLILERYEGKLPFWLTPEQVRLIPLEGIDLDPVIEILNRCQMRYTVDKESHQVKEKIYRALRVKVPYVILFGKKEENLKQVTIRTCGSNREQTMTFEQMEQLMMEHKFESQ